MRDLFGAVAQMALGHGSRLRTLGTSLFEPIAAFEGTMVAPTAGDEPSPPEAASAPRMSAPLPDIAAPGPPSTPPPEAPPMPTPPRLDRTPPVTAPPMLGEIAAPAAQHRREQPRRGRDRVEHPVAGPEAAITAPPSVEPAGAVAPEAERARAVQPRPLAAGPVRRSAERHPPPADTPTGTPASLSAQPAGTMAVAAKDHPSGTAGIPGAVGRSPSILSSAQPGAATVQAAPPNRAVSGEAERPDPALPAADHSLPGPMQPAWPATVPAVAADEVVVRSSATLPPPSAPAGHPHARVPIEITIGRIEIRAETPAPRARPTRPEPRISLADYKGRWERAR